MAIFNFCERDYAVTPYVREFWNVVSILGWVVFFSFILYRRYVYGFRFLNLPHTYSGYFQLAVSTIYYLDGIRIHWWSCHRYMTQELAVFIMMVPFLLETRCWLFPFVIVTPMLLRVLSSLGLNLFSSDASVMNHFMGLDFVPAMESLLSPVIVFLGCNFFVRIGLLPKNFQIALDHDSFLKWSMIAMFIGQALGRYLEAKGMCHLFPITTGIPLFDEFFTPHNLFDHIPSYFDYQLAIFFEYLVYLQRGGAPLKPGEWCNDRKKD